MKISADVPTEIRIKHFSNMAKRGPRTPMRPRHHFSVAIISNIVTDITQFINMVKVKGKFVPVLN
jgi:hypothetical protein